MDYSSKEQVRQLMRDRAICIIMPTFNNGDVSARVAGECLQWCADVIAVDDGCTDGSADLLEKVEGLQLVHIDRNRGKGYALKQGFKCALEHGFAYAITIDADGQHHTDDIARFVQANKQHPGAMVVGCRCVDESLRSKGSNFANKFSNFWFRLQTGKRLEDTQTGYRLYPLRKLHPLSLLSSRYEAELELLVFAAWHGVELVSLPVNAYYPPLGERVSHFRPVTDFARISVLNVILCVLAFFYGLPLRLGRCLGKLLRTAYSMLVLVLFSFLVLHPVVWFIKHTTGGDVECKHKRLHRLIFKIACFCMMGHGIPGTTFRRVLTEDVDFSKPRVIICNHQSHLDLLCQLVFTPNLIFMTNSWAWKNSFYGSLIREAEYLPVTDGMESLLPKLRSLVERGYSIALYPEGTRSEDCRVGRFHKGAFYLAQELALEVLPMYIYGTGKVMPKHVHHLNKGNIYVEVGKPISCGELQSMGELKAIASKMRKHYVEKYEAISNKMEQYA